MNKKKIIYLDYIYQLGYLDCDNNFKRVKVGTMSDIDCLTMRYQSVNQLVADLNLDITDIASPFEIRSCCGPERYKVFYRHGDENYRALLKRAFRDILNDKEEYLEEFINLINQADNLALRKGINAHNGYLKTNVSELNYNINKI